MAAISLKADADQCEVKIPLLLREYTKEKNAEARKSPEILEFP